MAPRRLQHRFRPRDLGAMVRLHAKGETIHEYEHLTLASGLSEVSLQLVHMRGMCNKSAAGGPVFLTFLLPNGPVCRASHAPRAMRQLLPPRVSQQ